MANRGFTKENAMQIAQLRRQMGKLGGRPKGVLNPATIKKIQTKQALEAVLQKKAGLLAENLLRASNNLDTRATEIALDRAFGKIPQGVNIQAVQFSLKDLAEYRKGLQQGDPQAFPEVNQPAEKKDI